MKWLVAMAKKEEKGRLITDLEEFDAFVESLTDDEWAVIDKEVEEGMQERFISIVNFIEFQL